MYRVPPHDMDMSRYWDPGHPYRVRTWLRPHLPSALTRLAPPGLDCEAVGGWHRWYNQDERHSGCYHCQVVAHGRLWETSPTGQPGGGAHASSGQA